IGRLICDGGRNIYSGADICSRCTPAFCPLISFPLMTSPHLRQDRFSFRATLQGLVDRQRRLLSRPNRVDATWYNGIVTRYVYPVVTADHVPLEWRYDLDPTTNPFLQERLAVNAVFNPGAIEM